MSIAQFHAVTHEGERLLGIIDEFGSFLHRLLVYLRIRIVRSHLLALHWLVLTSSHLGILGEVEDNRTWATATCNIEGTAHSPRHILRTTNLIRPF